MTPQLDLLPDDVLRVVSDFDGSPCLSYVCDSIRRVVRFRHVRTAALYRPLLIPDNSIQDIKSLVIAHDYDDDQLVQTMHQMTGLTALYIPRWPFRSPSIWWHRAPSLSRILEIQHPYHTRQDTDRSISGMVETIRTAPRVWSSTLVSLSLWVTATATITMEPANIVSLTRLHSTGYLSGLRILRVAMPLDILCDNEVAQSIGHLGGQMSELTLAFRLLVAPRRRLQLGTFFQALEEFSNIFQTLRKLRLIACDQVSLGRCVIFCSRYSALTGRQTNTSSFAHALLTDGVLGRMTSLRHLHLYISNHHIGDWQLDLICSLQSVPTTIHDLLLRNLRVWTNLATTPMPWQMSSDHQQHWSLGTELRECRQEMLCLLVVHIHVLRLQLHWGDSFLTIAPLVYHGSLRRLHITMLGTVEAPWRLAHFLCFVIRRCVSLSQLVLTGRIGDNLSGLLTQIIQRNRVIHQHHRQVKFLVVDIEKNVTVNHV